MNGAVSGKGLLILAVVFFGLGLLWVLLGYPPVGWRVYQQTGFSALKYEYVAPVAFFSGALLLFKHRSSKGQLAEPVRRDARP